MYYESDENNKTSDDRADGIFGRKETRLALSAGSDRTDRTIIEHIHHLSKSSFLNIFIGDAAMKAFEIIRFVCASKHNNSHLAFRADKNATKLKQKAKPLRRTQQGRVQFSISFSFRKSASRRREREESEKRNSGLNATCNDLLFRMQTIESLVHIRVGSPNCFSKSKRTYVQLLSCGKYINWPDRAASHASLID